VYFVVSSDRPQDAIDQDRGILAGGGWRSFLGFVGVFRGFRGRNTAK